MPSRFRTLSLLLALAFGAVLAPACGSAEDETCTGEKIELLRSGALTVAADYSYPPFAYRSAKGDLVGFDVDVMKALGAELDFEVRFVNRGTGALLPGALAGRHDIAASGLRDEPRLREEACVSAPYLDADLAVLTGPEGRQVTDVDDLADETVAIVDGSRADSWAEDNLDASTVAAFPTTDDVLSAVKQGQAAAAIEDHAVSGFAATQTKLLKVAQRLETEDVYVFAASPDNKALIERMNGGLKKLSMNGKMAKIRKKWFG